MTSSRTWGGNLKKEKDMKAIYPKSMRRIIPALLLVAILSACEQKNPVFPDFDYTAVYFPLQFPIRTLSLGEEPYDNSLDKELKFHIAPNIGGMYENNQDWVVEYIVDESLAVNVQNVNGDTILALPSSYYTLTPANQVTIPSGSFKGLIEVQLTQQFLDDPLAYGNHYVIPLKIVGSTADSILSGQISEANPEPDPRVPGQWIVAPKDFVLFGIKYINDYHGTYLHRGIDITYDSLNNPIDTAIYRKNYVVDDELWDLTTRGRNVVHSNGISINTGAVDGDYAMKLTFAENGQIQVDSLAGSAYAVSGTGMHVEDGDRWGGEPRDAIYLSYEFSDGPNLHRVKDTLVYRNRGIKFEEFNPVVPEIPEVK